MVSFAHAFFREKMLLPTITTWNSISHLLKTPVKRIPECFFTGVLFIAIAHFHAGIGIANMGFRIGKGERPPNDAPHYPECHNPEAYLQLNDSYQTFRTTREQLTPVSIQLYKR